MSKIILFLPGNIYHSNVIQTALKRMLVEEAGLKILRDLLIPIVFAWQWIDELLTPEIYNARSHELCVASWTHILHSQVSFQDSVRQIIKTPGRLDVTFYPEFDPPANLEAVQTEYFFLLGSQTRYYHDVVNGDLRTAPKLPKTPSVRFGSKVGIFINNTPEALLIRERWHTYQADPTQANLENLMKAVKVVANDQANKVQIVVWDLETPYVGSETDANELWSRFFEALDKEGLTSTFSRLEPHLPWFKEQAVEMPPPHRLLDKWTRHKAQLDYIRYAYDSFKADCLSEREQWLLAIAQSSDVLSAMDSKIQAQASKNSAVVKYREEIIRTGFACLDILKGEASLDILAEIDPLLGPRLIEFLRQKNESTA